jgi:hypothetical protein
VSRIFTCSSRVNNTIELEEVMKTGMKVAVALIALAASAAVAQDTGAAQREQTTDRPTRISMNVIVKSYGRCLNSDIQGVVEAALGHVTYVRIAYPNADLAPIHAKLRELVVRGATRDIRCKSFAALEVFNDPKAYQRYIANRDGNGDGILEELAPRVFQQGTLVAR